MVFCIRNRSVLYGLGRDPPRRDPEQPPPARLCVLAGSGACIWRKPAARLCKRPSAKKTGKMHLRDGTKTQTGSPPPALNLLRFLLSLHKQTADSCWQGLKIAWVQCVTQHAEPLLVRSSLAGLSIGQLQAAYPGHK